MNLDRRAQTVEPTAAALAASFGPEQTPEGGFWAWGNAGWSGPGPKLEEWIAAWEGQCRETDEMDADSRQ